MFDPHKPRPARETLYDRIEGWKDAPAALAGAALNIANVSQGTTSANYYNAGDVAR